ncbi:vitamin K epoxide reductase family protein [Candidatus Pacearchaeota archaeon]|nr:vitamin K epoxide reductase family protein [Candidatus Pacearchaeota archaeon]MBI2057111.1 vitamin K epoxide reductase family protein [Candidatus Pacearchaeota archaeon]
MKNKILLIIFLVSLISSIIILSTNHGNSNFCGIDEKGGCNAVQNSKYASFFGINNSIYGIFIFAMLSILTFSQMQKPIKNKQLLIDSAVILGFIIALYFIFLQIFILKTFCKYCLIIDGLMILAFLLVILGEIKKNKK